MAAEAYVIEAVRTAVGKRNGSLAGVHPVDLGAAGWRGPRYARHALRRWRCARHHSGRLPGGDERTAGAMT